MKSKQLEVGDKLFAYGSWAFSTIVIVDVNLTEAISNNGFRFKRDFTDGQTYSNRDKPFVIDLQHWFLDSNK